MNVWQWVYDATDALRREDPALASQLWRLPQWVSDGEHDQVEAALPAVVAALRARGAAWLEVYARHWGLQSRILHRNDVSTGLQEAVDLLERAHRPDAIGCPQSVCVSQDLCAAYGVADGPGYARERQQVSLETLARIDRTWSCWDCIGAEYLDALLDEDRPEDALRWCEENAGSEMLNLLFGRFEALVRVGRGEEARAQLAAADLAMGGRNMEIKREVLLAWSLAREGRAGEAQERLPPFAEVRGDVSLYPEYGETALALLAGGARELSGAQLAELASLSRTLERNGAIRRALRLAVQVSEFAIDSDQRAIARVFLDQARALAPRLRAGLGDPERIEAAQARLAALPAAAPPGEDPRGDEPLSFDAADALARRFPDRAGLVVRVAQQWRGLGWPEEALALLRAAHAQAPEDGEVFSLLLGALLDAGEIAAAQERIAAGISSSNQDLRGHALWYRSRERLRAGDLRGALDALADLWEGLPGWPTLHVRREMARLSQAAGDREGALLLWREINQHPDVQDEDRWHLAVAASLLGRWADARAASRALGHPLTEAPEDAPLEESWGLVDLVVPGRAQPLVALRTGPATARIVGIYGPHEPERHRELHVFDPAPLPAEEGAERTPYRSLAVLEPSACAGWDVCGARLSPDQVQALAALARAHGGDAFCATGEDYELAHPQTGEPVPGGYVRMALSRGGSGLQEALAALDALAGQAAAPLLYPDLLAALGEDERAAQHRQAQRDWGIWS